MKATWHDAVLAESDAIIELDGDLYFPASSVNMDYLKASSHQMTSPRYGKARYYHVIVNNETSENAAWYYSDPTEAARGVEDCIAFGKNIEVSE